MQTAVGVGALALTIIGTGVAVSCSVNSTAVALHGEVRQDLWALTADVQELGERVTRVEVLIEAGGQHQTGGRATGTTQPEPGTD